MSEFTADGTDRTTTLRLSGLTCDHCVAHVTEELKALDGVKNVSVVLSKGGQSVATVVSDVVLDDAALAEAIDEAGDYTLDAVERDEACPPRAPASPNDPTTGRDARSTRRDRPVTLPGHARALST